MPQIFRKNTEARASKFLFLNERGGTEATGTRNMGQQGTPKKMNAKATFSKGVGQSLRACNRGEKSTGTRVDSSKTCA